MTARSWDPELHPRLPGGPGGGEFTHTVSGWLESLSDTSGKAVGDGPRWRRAKDRIRPKMRIPGERIASHRGEADEGPDRMLGEVYRLQGYHTKPEVLPAEQMDRRVASGWTEVFRGFGDLPDAKRYVEDFRSGDEHYPGLGVRGNGTYSTTVFQEAHEYTDPPISDEAWTALSDEQMYEMDASLAADHTKWPGILRMAISPHARIADYNPTYGPPGQLWDEFMADRAAAREQSRDDLAAIQDLGRYAALRGYDAIRIPGGLGSIFGMDDETADHYIILNRGAVAVQAAP